MKRKELALAYSPGVSLRGAYNNLHNWIDRNEDLKRQLFANGFTWNSKELLPIHVRLIHHYLGEP